MCGILSYIGAPSDRIAALVTSGLAKQHSRGMDGAGYILIPHWRHDKPIVRRFLSPFHAIMQLQKDIDEHCDRDGLTSIAFHHRFPTSTANEEHCNHPIASGTGFLIHNGIINNAHELKIEHEKNGIVYSTIDAQNKFNDSEALAHDVAFALLKPKKYKSGRKYFFRSTGWYAFVRYEPETGRLQYGRNPSAILQSARLENGTLALTSERDYALADSKAWSEIPSRVLHTLTLPAMKLHTDKFTFPKPPPPPPMPKTSFGSLGSECTGWEYFDDRRGYPACVQSSFIPKSGELYLPAKHRLSSITEYDDDGFLYVPKAARSRKKKFGL